MSATANTPLSPVLANSPTSAGRGTKPRGSTTQKVQRLPPPALFQGPPSKSTGPHISLDVPDRPPPTANIKNVNDGTPQTPRASRIPPAASFSGPAMNMRNAGGPKRDDSRAEVIWEEMQRTLADVELSAMNSSHVFGASHARALEELRQSQLMLAQAWAKSEAEEISGHDFDFEAESDANVVGSWNKSGVIPGKRASGNATASSAGGTLNSAGTGGHKQTLSASSDIVSPNRTLEEETERDILLARKRREANDRYFEQVNKGVLDVVRKLDEVASAMKRVEQESREIWHDTSDENTSVHQLSPNLEEAESDASGLSDSPKTTRT